MVSGCRSRAAAGKVNFHGPQVSESLPPIIIHLTLQPGPIIMVRGLKSKLCPAVVAWWLVAGGGGYNPVIIPLPGSSGGHNKIHGSSVIWGKYCHYSDCSTPTTDTLDFTRISQSRRRPLLGPSPGWKWLLALSHLRHYAKWVLTHSKASPAYHDLH